MTKRYKHIRLMGTRREVPYVYAGPTPQSTIDSPPRPAPSQHGLKILDRLSKARERAERELSKSPSGSGLSFIPMEIVESNDFALMVEQLERSKLDFKIVNVRVVEGKTRFTVALPTSKVAEFDKRVRQYMTELDKRHGTPKSEKLMTGIEDILPFDWSQYWTDEGIIPVATEQFWWEIWLRTDDETPAAVSSWFRDAAKQTDLRISDRYSEFPERIVFLGFSSLERWRNFPGLLQYLAEFRRASIVAGEFLSLTPEFQGEFIRNLKHRISAAPASSPAVCILDTGVNRGHPLLEESLNESNNLAWRLDWGTDDHDGHGTEMAGLALFGCDLANLLFGNETHELSHRLESVKILPPTGVNDAPQYGPITIGAMLLTEEVSPERQRVFSMSITAPGSNTGAPSLWSASIDQVTSGAIDGKRRLFLVSAGNLPVELIANYPNDNYTEPVEDPSQSWNAITVGAFTDLIWDGDPTLSGYKVVAPRGSLSPASRTSLTWADTYWPYKPDVVFEGGNCLISQNGFATNTDDLSLLTVSMNPTSKSLLGASRDTSAATAQAARMAALLQAEYPDYWPETIRALIVHSAEWTEQMLTEFPRNKRGERVKVYGMGVPDLDRARDTVESYTTMIIEDSIQPYRREGANSSYNNMHVHQLPIPVEVLRELGSTQVRMKVTLSYFVEPNPPRRGNLAQFRYASHGLRFSLIRPGENLQFFQDRLSKIDWPTNDETGRKKRPRSSVTDERRWDLGESYSTRGSIHSDGWTGTAAELAQCGYLAVIPVSGWWKERIRLGQVEKQTRYSLVISISTNDTSIELYTAIQQMIGVSAAIPI
jgi:hypothetical protein